jgi:hypothetical protein
MNKVERLKAELALAQAEEKFVETKTAYRAGDVDEAAYRKAKEAIRAKREDYRTNYRRIVGVQPAPVEVSVD